MDYTYKFRLLPTSHQRERLDWVRDTVRQLYNHALHRYNRTLIPIHCNIGVFRTNSHVS
ncbi:MAG: helix-turn-helix domain-containing protein [Halapricum sp.]